MTTETTQETTAQRIVRRVNQSRMMNPMTPTPMTLEELENLTPTELTTLRRKLMVLNHQRLEREKLEIRHEMSLITHLIRENSLREPTVEITSRKAARTVPARAAKAAKKKAAAKSQSPAPSKVATAAPTKREAMKKLKKKG